MLFYKTTRTQWIVLAKIQLMTFSGTDMHDFSQFSLEL